MGDRHKGNMVLVGGEKLANIDFGWLEQGPRIDTGMFPIPQGLQNLLTSEKNWDEFHDLMWDALKTLEEHMPRIQAHWKAVMEKLDFHADKFLYTNVPLNMARRVSLDADRFHSLDEPLRAYSWKTS